MRRLMEVVLVAVLVVGVTVPAAQAGTGTNVALGLASFAVFNQLVGGVFHARPVYARPVVVYSSPPPVYSVPATVVTVPSPPPPSPTVVHYPHGRYELRGDGVTQPYLWVWIPNPPPPPPPPAPLQ